MNTLAALLIAVPFLAAVLGLLGGRRLPGGPAPVAVAGAVVSTALAVALAVPALRGPARLRDTATLLTPTGGIPVTIGTRVDSLAAVVAVMVCVVALLVQVYSTAYLAGDPRYPSYAGLVSLFTAAMLLVVLSGDLLVLLVGWEVMGACSYFLIGHYRQQPAAGAAATKAFLTTRVGDVGFLFGIFVLGSAAGSFRIGTVIARAPAMDHRTVLIGTLLLTCGVIGKSAQFPLHTWLPDAMAGPTPISALIHAATMVAAGVYLIARVYPVFLLSPVTLDVLALVAAVTMVLGGLAALAQDDLKRVLAYSTVSQLAYMVGGLAVGGYTAGLFHLLTHAAFKALLFLSAGAVIRTVGTNLMSGMGGLRRGMPVTFVTATIGLASLAGVPPLSGFVSKDAVLVAAREAARSPHPVLDRPVAAVVLVAGLLTVAITAAYVTRLWLRTFFGVHRGDAVVREAPPAMTVPLVLLAVPAALLGLVDLVGIEPAEWLGLPGHPDGYAFPMAGPPDIGTTSLAFLLVLAGVMGVVLLWRRDPTLDPARLLGPLRRPFERAFYLDDVYGALLVRPLPRLARAVLAVDTGGVDRTVTGSGTAARLLGGGLRRLQNGNVQAYATGLIVGVVLLAAGAAALG